jgi:hypothetical protein
MYWTVLAFCIFIYPLTYLYHSLIIWWRYACVNTYVLNCFSILHIYLPTHIFLSSDQDMHMYMHMSWNVSARKVGRYIFDVIKRCLSHKNISIFHMYTCIPIYIHMSFFDRLGSLFCSQLTAVFAHYRQKISVFRKNQCYDSIFVKMAVFWKNKQFFSPYF